MDTQLQRDPELAAKVHYDQLDRLCRRTVGGSIGALVFAIVMAIHLQAEVGTTIWLWLIAKTVIGIVRLVFSLFWKSNKLRFLALHRRLAILRLLLLVDGTVLGSVCIFSLQSAAPETTLLWSAVVLCGVCAVAISTLESDWVCSLCYCGPVLGIGCTSMLFLASNFGISTGIGIMIFGFVLLLNARTAYNDERQRLVQGHAIQQYQSKTDDALKIAKQEASLRTEFISSVTHELRTPLHGILGLTNQVMKDGSEMSAVQIEHAARMIKRSGEHLLGLINDILDVSKFQAMGVVLSREVFDLHDVVEDVETMASMISREKGVLFSVTSSLTSPYFVHADARRLRQILLNLIGNGIKFTNVGGRVSLSVGMDGCNADITTFSVTDSGIGIEADKIHTIFEPFAQVATDRSFIGSGLGLSITKRLVLAMNGALSVQSVFGKGSTFTADLPLERVVLSERLRSGTLPESVVPKMLTGYVLLADDDPVTALLSVAALEKVGLRVRHVTDGEQAVAYATSSGSRPDLVLMDCEMPGMNGFTAARAIRDSERLRFGNHIPIIAVTGLAGHADQQRAKAAGMNGYLTKPFESVALISLIEEVLDGDKSSLLTSWDMGIGKGSG